MVMDSGIKTSTIPHLYDDRYRTLYFAHTHIAVASLCKKNADNYVKVEKLTF